MPRERVDVWIISLSDVGNPMYLARFLSADERSRAERFAFDRDRRRFCLGRQALRGILATYLRCDPRKLNFVYGESGKPRLKAGAIDLEFNAAGSGDLAVCAVTCGTSVGTDIEQLRESVDLDLVPYALSAIERADFENISVTEQASTFYRTWTRKEAYVKAVGCGLSRPLASFSVSVMPGQKPRLVRDDSDPAAEQDWAFADFDPAPGWVGTVVSRGGPRPIRRLTWPV